MTRLLFQAKILSPVCAHYSLFLDVFYFYCFIILWQRHSAFFQFILLKCFAGLPLNYKSNYYWYSIPKIIVQHWSIEDHRQVVIAIRSITLQGRYGRQVLRKLWSEACSDGRGHSSSHKSLSYNTSPIRPAPLCCCSGCCPLLRSFNWTYWRSVKSSHDELVRRTSGSCTPDNAIIIGTVVWIHSGASGLRVRGATARRQYRAIGQVSLVLTRLWATAQERKCFEGQGSCCFPPWQLQRTVQNHREQQLFRA